MRPGDVVAGGAQRGRERSPSRPRPTRAIRAVAEGVVAAGFRSSSRMRRYRSVAEERGESQSAPRGVAAVPKVYPVTPELNAARCVTSVRVALPRVPGAWPAAPPPSAARSLSRSTTGSATATTARSRPTRTKLVFGAGNADADMMFVGEAPGQQEDLQGLPFVGRAGQLLNELLGEIGMSREDVFIANVLKCRPPGNRDPLPDEIAECEPHLREQIRLIEPKVICTLGNFATKLLTGQPTGITRVHGRPQEREMGGLPSCSSRSSTRPRRCARPAPQGAARGHPPAARADRRAPARAAAAGGAGHGHAERPKRPSTSSACSRATRGSARATAAADRGTRRPARCPRCRDEELQRLEAGRV